MLFAYLSTQFTLDDVGPLIIVREIIIGQTAP